MRIESLMTLGKCLDQLTFCWLLWINLFFVLILALFQKINSLFKMSHLWLKSRFCAWISYTWHKDQIKKKLLLFCFAQSWLIILIGLSFLFNFTDLQVSFRAVKRSKINIQHLYCSVVSHNHQLIHYNWEIFWLKTAQDKLNLMELTPFISQHNKK